MGDIYCMRNFFILILCSIFLISCTSKGNETIEQNDNVDKTNEQAEINENDKTGEVAEEVFALPAVELQKGDQNDDVSLLQQGLKDIGYPVQETGYFDDLTTWAVTDFQMQKENLMVTGVYEKNTQTFLNEALQGENTIEIGSKLSQPNNPNEYPEIVENPYEILALVNKSHALPNTFEPEDLVIPDIPFPFEEDDPKKQLREPAARAIEDLFKAAEKEDLELFAQSGYRSYDRQDAIFASYVSQHGENHANTYSARPGESEHQTGLVMDVTTRSIGFDIIMDFKETPEGKWLKEHAHEYGYIIRYEEGKEEITKYQYEPWHIRYVGKKAAKEIYENDLTLEEYLDAN